MNPRIIITIARKDIVDALRNFYILGAIVLPLGFWILFRIVFPSESTLQIGPVAIYDLGSSRLVEQLRSQPSIERIIKVDSFEALTEKVQREAVGGLALPADFDTAVATGNTPELTLVLNRQRGGGELNAFRNLIDKQLQLMANRTPIAQITEQDVNAPLGPLRPDDFNFHEFILVVLLVMGLTMTGVFVVPLLLVEEKEKHTLKTILVSPASYLDVVAGKAIVGLFYALVGSGILVALNNGLRGNVGLLVLAIMLSSLVVVEIGLLMGAFFNTSTQVNTLSSIVMVLLLIPSWTTGIWISGPVVTVMRLLPTYYMVQMIQAARGDLSADNTWVSAGVLTGCVAVFFAANVWLLRRVKR